MPRTVTSSSARVSGPTLKRTAAFALAAVAGLSAAAFGQSDKDMTTPTGWIWQLGVSGATVSGLHAQGWRVTDIERVGSNLYDVLSVADTGSYAKTNESVYVNVLPETLASSLTNNNQRLTDLEVYDAGAGVIRMSATAVRNTGADGAGWGWLWHTSAASINAWINNAPDNAPLRLVDIDTYFVGDTRYYSAVAVVNTGAQQQTSWHFFDKTADEIATLLNQRGARLTDLEVHDAPTLFSQATYTGIMVDNNGTGWWWYPSITGAALADVIDLNAARLIDLEEYDTPFGTRYAAIMVDNANALTRDVRQVVSDGVSPGAQGGGFIKEVDGGVLAAVGADHVFEPASMLKILYGAYAIDRCAAGSDSLNALVFVGDRCNNNECPDANQCNPGNETLSAAIAEMLEQSDNNRTKVIHDRYGRAVLNAYADALGMTRTQINHDIGCGLPANEFTLRDAATLYEKIADGSLFSQSWQDTLYGLMIDATGNQGTLSSVIGQEAASTNLTAAELTAFRNACYMASKGGSYGVNGVSHRTTGGWMRLPFKVNGVVTPREYAITSFVNNDPDGDGAGAANSAIWWTMGRDRVRAALASWDAACNAPNVTLNPANKTVCHGAVVVFGGSTQGTAPLTYRWYKGASQLSDGPGPGGSTIAGAHSAALVISGVNALNAGQYSYRVTNACGTDTSGSATLTVRCRADYDCSGGAPNVADIFAFLSDWFAADEKTDVDGSGDVGVSDIFAFLSLWFAGCL